MLIRMSTCGVLLLMVAAGLAAQEKKPEPGRTMQTFRFDAKNSLLILELGALIAEEDKKVSVKLIPPEDRRPKDVAGEDIEKGDEVGMANGKRVANLSELKKFYDDAPIGSEFKLGVRRDGQPRIV